MEKNNSKKQNIKKSEALKENKAKQIAEEITVKEETKDDEVFYDDKEKGKIVKIIWNIVFYGILVVFAFCAVFGIINFNKVKDGNEPSGYASAKTYVENANTVTVYNYYAYKIVKVYNDETGKNTVSLKLWFLDDIN